MWLWAAKQLHAVHLPMQLMWFGLEGAGLEGSGLEGSGLEGSGLEGFDLKGG